MDIPSAVDHNTILGEAAINLILRKEEITVMAILGELQAMLRNESDNSRHDRILATRRWLFDYRRPGSSSAKVKRSVSPYSDKTVDTLDEIKIFNSKS